MGMGHERVCRKESHGNINARAEERKKGQREVVGQCVSRSEVEEGRKVRPSYMEANTIIDRPHLKVGQR